MAVQPLATRPFTELKRMLICPITHEEMTDPYIAMSCGHSFEKAAIDEHMTTSHWCPVDRALIISILPNRALKDTIDEVKAMEAAGGSVGGADQISALTQRILSISPPSDPALLEQTTKLFVACQAGDIDALTPLLNRDLLLSALRIFDPFPRQSVEKYKGWTVLHEAAFHKKLNIIKLLLRTAPELYKTFRADGLTPFHAAALGGDFLTLKFLYDQDNTIINIHAEKKYTCLYAALLGKNRNSIRWLIRLSPQLLQLKPQEGTYPLGEEKAILLLDILKECPDPTELDLRGNLLTYQIGPHLNTYLNTANLLLHELLLGDNHLGDNGLEAMASGLQAVPSLRKLSLNTTQLTDDGADIVARLISQSATLKEVDLSSNYISDAGAIALAQAIINNTSLERLTLFGCQITDVGARALAEALSQRATPLTLSLLQNQLSASAKAELSALPTHKVIT